MSDATLSLVLTTSDDSFLLVDADDNVLTEIPQPATRQQLREWISGYLVEDADNIAEDLVEQLGVRTRTTSSSSSTDELGSGA